MKTWMWNLRYFLLGFIPTLCLFGLVGGILTVWLRSAAALMPETPSLTLERAENGWTVTAFGEEHTLSLPGQRLEAAVSRFPTLVPRELRLAAWGADEIFGENWQEYLEEKLPQ
mgnify:FL=1